VTWLVRNESGVHLPLKGGEHPPRAPFHSLTTSHRSCCSSSGKRERRALLHLSGTNLSLLQQERRKKRRFQIPGPKEQRNGVHPRLSLSVCHGKVINHAVLSCQRERGYRNLLRFCSSIALVIIFPLTERCGTSCFPTNFFFFF
jgi:hypothetical protein